MSVAFVGEGFKFSCDTGLRFLLPYMQPYRGLPLIGLVYGLIGANTHTPAALGYAVDELPAQRSQELRS